MKINKELLRNLIWEQISEAYETEAYETMADDGETSLASGSVDAQIDAFIIKYERDAIPRSTGDDDLSESLLGLTLYGLLNEQEEAAEGEQEAVVDTAGEEEETDVISEPESDEDLSDVEAAESSPKPPLDIDSFSRRIARLALNFETLLDVKGTIIRRALKFLEENYDTDHADKLVDILNTKFDFEIGESAEDPEAPFAVGAYAGGTGTGGGAV